MHRDQDATSEGEHLVVVDVVLALVKGDQHKEWAKWTLHKALLKGLILSHHAPRAVVSAHRALIVTLNALLKSAR